MCKKRRLTIDFGVHKAWSLYSCNNCRTCLRSCFKAVDISYANISCANMNTYDQYNYLKTNAYLESLKRVFNHVLAILTTYMDPYNLNVKMVDHLIIIIIENFLEQNSQRHKQKIGCMGKSCSQSCFPRSFEYCIFLWTWHLERLSYQSVISRTSTAVTHCRCHEVMSHEAVVL